MQRQDKEYMHGLLGVEAAKIQGIFRDESKVWDIYKEHEVATAADDMDMKLQRWRSQLEQSSLLADTPNPLSAVEELPSEPRVQPISDLLQNGEEHDEMNIGERNDVEQLNEDQRRAYNIIDRHLNETIVGKKPPQLLMAIPGEGGVGKTKLIQTIMQDYHQRGMEDRLVKGAYTGIVASLINGKTLHVLAGIPVRGGKQSAQTLQKLREFWRTKLYLVIDEISMLSHQFFAKMSRIISITLEIQEEKVFGGLNVIVTGDFHQFPHVVACQSAPLYWPVDSRRDSEEEIIGQKVFEQFTMVVQLKKQMRVQDPEWHDLLQHVRYGNCLQSHIDELKKLIIKNPQCPETDYNTPPWNDARLVTPRHAVRSQWNSATIKKYCGKNN